jgi:tripartite-type tricarboxylate transporter receptor subunit TctC
MNRRNFLKSAVALSPILAAQISGSRVHAEANWPRDRIIRWVIGLAPAGTTDPLTRAIAPPLSQRIGQTIIVENKPGASQVVGARDVASSPADGYTLLSIGGPQLYSDNAVPIVGRGLDPLIRMATQPMIIAGTTSRPTPDLKAVIAAAKANPGDWAYASAGYGSSQHVAGELLNSVAGTKILHVPYKGGGAAVKDAAAGHVPLIVVGVGPILPFIKSGAMRGYALTTAKRMASLPDIPTMEELGFQDFDLAQWHGAAIKSGTPRPIIDRLNLEMRAILSSPPLEALLDNLGAENGAGTPEEWGSFYAAETAKWGALMKKLNINIE